MGIRISERTDLFHVPYGSLNSEGTPENSFIDLKANPSWISVLPSCVGWPEAQTLLQILNSPASGMMSLAADQAFVDQNRSHPQAPLTSFVTICFADAATNTRSALSELAEHLNQRLTRGLQGISNALQRSLNLDIVLELQPTLFHTFRIEGWSLTVLLAVFGDDKAQTRDTWGLCMRMLGQVLEEHGRGSVT